MPTGSTKKGLCQCLMSREVMQCMCVCECDGVCVLYLSRLKFGQWETLFPTDIRLRRKCLSSCEYNCNKILSLNTHFVFSVEKPATW